jgi:ABC-type branched-subunit amino acid transport system ATPase component
VAILLVEQNAAMALRLASRGICWRRVALSRRGYGDAAGKWIM